MTLDQPNEGVQIQGETAVTAPADGVAPVQHQPAGDDVESKARSQGWVPREEFRGDPEKWRPADEFVRRGEELLPVALERSRAAERKAQELEQQLRARDEQFTRLERVTAVALQRQREDLEARYQAAQRAAVEVGDVQRYDQLDRDRRQAVQQYDEQIQEQAQPQRQPNQPQPLPPQVEAVVESWKSANEWFNRDPLLNHYATAFHGDLLRSKPGLSLADNLAETAREVRRRFPEKFGSPSQQFAPMVEGGGGRMPASRSAGKGVSHLSSEERRAGEKFVKEGLFKSLDEYAKELFSEG